MRLDVEVDVEVAEVLADEVDMLLEAVVLLDVTFTVVGITVVTVETVVGGGVGGGLIKKASATTIISTTPAMTPRFIEGFATR